jgi:MoaA/NifB/PqqE/SkfB family radical SAM enzyme
MLFYLPWWFFQVRFLGKKKPLQTVLFINNQCNLKCKHCAVYVQSNPVQKSYQQIREELEYSYRLGARFVDFEGGEPTLWKRKNTEYAENENNIEALNSLCRLAKEIGFYSTTITTNAQLPFAGLEADLIWVSLDGVGDYHDDIRGKGTFEHLKTNIETARHSALNVNMVINSRNYASVEQTIKFVKQSPHLQYISLNFHTPIGNNDDLFLDWKQRRTVIDLIINMKRDGYPIMNSVSGLKRMKDLQFKKRCWITNFIMADGIRYSECQGKTANVCDRCGFSMSGEMSSVFNFKLDTIWAGWKLRG